MIRSLPLFALLFVLACDRQQTPEAAPPGTVERTETTAAEKAAKHYETPPGVTTDDGVARHDELVAGKPRQHWIDTYGPPDGTQQFFIKDGVHEYQIELRNVFRDDDPDFDEVEIHEDRWKQDDYTFLLWSFRKSPGQPWEALQAMAYDDGIEF